MIFPEQTNRESNATQANPFGATDTATRPGDETGAGKPGWPFFLAALIIFLINFTQMLIVYNQFDLDQYGGGVELAHSLVSIIIAPLISLGLLLFALIRWLQRF